MLSEVAVSVTSMTDECLDADDKRLDTVSERAEGGLE